MYTTEVLPVILADLFSAVSLANDLVTSYLSASWRLLIFGVTATQINFPDRTHSNLHRLTSLTQSILPPDQPKRTYTPSSILLPRTLTFAPGTRTGAAAGEKKDTMNSSSNKQSRRRRSSSVIIYKEPLEPPEQIVDQSALPNLNASWVNGKGTSSFSQWKAPQKQLQHQITDGTPRKQEHG